jgi:hypothetical protein
MQPRQVGLLRVEAPSTCALATFHPRESRRAGIDWRLTTDDARIKLRKLYASTEG